MPIWTHVIGVTGCTMSDEHFIGNDDTQHTIILNLGDFSSIHLALKASMIVLAGWEIGREIVLADEKQVIGRSSMADVQIIDQSVSREHVRIDRVSGDGDYYEITDLNSSNGTLVNNIAITNKRLNNGDKIQLGNILFKFVYQDKLDEVFHQNIHRLIHYDHLTGLLSMDTFRAKLEEQLAGSTSTTRFVIAMTDLDGLKRVNDSFGHLAGRSVIEAMGEMMRSCIRAGDFAGLYGGDEAIIFFANALLEDARVVSEKIRVTIMERIFTMDGKSFSVSISQGLSQFPVHGTTVEQLIAAADGALYRAKADGRNCICTA